MFKIFYVTLEHSDKKYRINVKIKAINKEEAEYIAQRKYKKFRVVYTLPYSKKGGKNLWI